MIAWLLIAQDITHSNQVWEQAVAKHTKITQMEVSFESYEANTKQLIYKGSFSYNGPKKWRFQYQDLVEKCEAGADPESTWVSPSEMRGYNDTVSSRQPYLVVNLCLGRGIARSSPVWDKDVQVEGFSKVIKGTDDAQAITLVIDARKSLVNRIESSDMASEHLVTHFTYKKVR